MEPRPRRSSRYFTPRRNGVDRGRDLYANPPAGLYVPPSLVEYVPPSLFEAVSSGSLAKNLAPGSLASLFGSNLALTTSSAQFYIAANNAGVSSLRVTDSSGATALAPLLYVSRSQINFRVPEGTAVGDISLEIGERSRSTPQDPTAPVSKIARDIFVYDDNRAVMSTPCVSEPDGKITVIPPRYPIVPDDRPINLVLYATGIRNLSSLAAVQATVGKRRLPVLYAGPDGGGTPGLDKINIHLTPAAKEHQTSRYIAVDGVPSNTVLIDVF